MEVTETQTTESTLTSTPFLGITDHFQSSDQVQVDAISHLNIANILSNSSQILPASSFDWLKLINEKQMNHIMTQTALPNPWAFNFSIPPQLQSRFQSLLNRGTGVENPLDLSSNKTGFGLQQLDNLLNVVQPEKSPTSNIEVKANAMRRNYSVEDLTQAVEDIRQGKLGTRRASVVYGIPRSTLRNKIYKLEAEGSISRNRRQKLMNNYKSDNEKTVKTTQSDSDSSSPKPSLYPSSPDSTNSSVEGATFTPENGAIFKSLTPTDAATNISWVDTLWQNLFKSQNTKMTPNVMNLNVNANSENGWKPAKLTKAGEHEEWRRSRPKRGQYRKYDKNALDEAVKSVRRGEMSVHRAGSFFGVPHSTLEYKVKERNLLRKKKDSSSIPTHTEYNDESVSFVSSTTEKQEDITCLASQFGL